MAGPLMPTSAATTRVGQAIEGAEPRLAQIKQHLAVRQVGFQIISAPGTHAGPVESFQDPVGALIVGPALSQTPDASDRPNRPALAFGRWGPNQLEGGHLRIRVRREHLHEVALPAEAEGPLVD